MATEKQNTARARNYFKFVLTGLPKPINRKYLTDSEKRLWDNILLLRNKLLSTIDIGNKEFGLNTKIKSVKIHDDDE